jgi:hypothetical protein
MTISKDIAIAVMLLGSLLLFGCGGGGGGEFVPPTPALSVKAQDWSFTHSPGMPASPESSNTGKWQFDFPTQDGVHYLLTPYTTPLAGIITVSVNIVGVDPQFTYLLDGCSSPGVPPTARVMFQRNGDDLIDENGRWWGYMDAIPLKVGMQTIVIPVTPSRWTNVYGKNGLVNEQGFATAVANPGRIGLTFGGGCSFGHGAWLARGTSRFTLMTFKVGPS